MPITKLKIVSICSEVDPFSKTGGLADVARSLPKALKRQGHLVRIFTPLYPHIDKSALGLKLIHEQVALQIDETKTVFFSIWQGNLMEGLPVYFIEEAEYLSRSYWAQPKSNTLYYGPADNQRYYIFNLAVITSLDILDITPDVIQCHDWQTGLIPYLLKNRFIDNTRFAHAVTVLTIHNLTYQMGNNWWEIPLNQRDDEKKPLPKFGETNKFNTINFAKRGIANVDIINTVSEQYAEEIMTKKFGNGLHNILKQKRHHLFGIVNGIDYADWNPSTDPGLTEKYDYNSLASKTKNKIHLQKYLNLPPDPRIPLICWTSRLTEQKGIELIMEIIEPLLRMEIQLVILGEGAKKYEDFFKKISRQHPKKIAAILDFDNQKETMVLAGADIFILPSRFEPCGLAQLKSLRYGAIPVVHAVGGLADTISDFNSKTGRGNGFIFKKYDSRDLLVAITRAVVNHRHRESWLKLVRTGMQQSFSWEIPAQKYVTLFRKALRDKSKYE
jgi:starch synthase